MFNTTIFHSTCTSLPLFVGYEHPTSHQRKTHFALVHLGCCLKVTISFTRITSDLLESSLTLLVYY